MSWSDQFRQRAASPFARRLGERPAVALDAKAPQTFPKATKAGEKVLRAVHPNAGIEAAYRAALRALLEEMHCSITYWLSAAYRANEPAIAQVDPADGRLAQDAVSVFPTDQAGEKIDMALDAAWRPSREDKRESLEAFMAVVQAIAAMDRAVASGIALDAVPAAALRKAVRLLARRWTKKWNDAAPKLAKWFAQSAATRSDKVLAKILKDAGIAVEFRMTAAARDVIHASVNQSVALIKSIPQQYLAQVEVLVMQSVQQGRDLAPLAKQLQKQFGVTQRRAALISRDQNNKATAAMMRARQAELGITEAIWLHSGGGREPRPTHVKNSGKRYNVATGWYDPAEKKWIFPGELIRCRCVSRPVIKGFS